MARIGRGFKLDFCPVMAMAFTHHDWHRYAGMRKSRNKDKSVQETAGSRYLPWSFHFVIAQVSEQQYLFTVSYVTHE